ncbi:Uncharacterized protein APZ42_006329 [Daphnia magna]|uniref:Uncharacterized protein n=1 Tax=Daphnia magna TaxID=35525 RepID=A0A164FYS2_9CRUS|nr:Uncharacterized protein APZ42_006329 [Daphnia magna]
MKKKKKHNCGFLVTGEMYQLNCVRGVRVCECKLSSLRCD